MRRIRFDLLRAEEELAGARQCILCLCGALLTALIMAILYKFGLMPGWGSLLGGLLLLLFLLFGTAFAWFPAQRQNHHPPRR